MTGAAGCIYFAYGSNMSLAQMRLRCPHSRAIGIGRLPEHRLCFPRHSPKRNCGAAGFEPCPGEELWGVLYELAASDLAELDRCEGRRPEAPPGSNRYDRATVTVVADGALRPCLTYRANPQPGQHLPSAAYMATIVEGATENGLPVPYIAMLKRLPLLAG